MDLPQLLEFIDSKVDKNANAIKNAVHYMSMSPHKQKEFISLLVRQPNSGGARQVKASVMRSVYLLNKFLDDYEKEIMQITQGNSGNEEGRGDNPDITQV